MDNKENFLWYLEHQKELVPKYDGKHLIIHEGEIADAFDTRIEAYRYGVKKFGLGNFIIQLCTEGESAYTITNYSMLNYV